MPAAVAAVVEPPPSAPFGELRLKAPTGEDACSDGSVMLPRRTSGWNGEKLIGCSGAIGGSCPGSYGFDGR